jgi:hypothetical protein
VRLLNAMRTVMRAALRATVPIAPVEPRTAVVPVPRLVSHTGPARRAGREPPVNVIDAARRSRQRWHCTHLDEHRAIASGKR